MVSHIVEPSPSPWLRPNHVLHGSIHPQDAKLAADARETGTIQSTGK